MPQFIHINDDSSLDFFNNITKSEPKKPMIVKYYMTGCIHCTKLEPEWNKFEDQLKVNHDDDNNDNDDKSMVIQLNSNFMDKANIPNVMGFPTISYIKEEEKIDHDGERTADEIMKFYKKALNALIQNGGNKTRRNKSRRNKTRRNKTKKNKTRRNKTKRNKTKRNKKGGRENLPQDTPQDMPEYIGDELPENILEDINTDENIHDGIINLELTDDGILLILRNENASTEELKQIIMHKNQFDNDNNPTRLTNTSKIGYAAILKYNNHPEINYADDLYYGFELDARAIIEDSVPENPVEGVVYYDTNNEPLTGLHFLEQFTNP